MGRSWCFHWLVLHCISISSVCAWVSREVSESLCVCLPHLGSILFQTLNSCFLPLPAPSLRGTEVGPNQTTRSLGNPLQACLQLSPFPRNALLLSNLSFSIFPQEMSVLYGCSERQAGDGGEMCAWEPSSNL